MCPHPHDGQLTGWANGAERCPGENAVAGTTQFSDTIDVAAWIDRSRISALQVTVFALCFLLSALDGFDSQIIGFVAPAVIHDFHVARVEMSGVFAAGVVGLFIGSAVIAPFADRIGRKRVMVGSALLFGAMSLATAGAHSLTSLFWLRLLTGVGIGGALPNGIALTAEYLPARRRAALTMAMFVGFPLGLTVGGVLAAWMVPSYGWRILFTIGGVLPIGLAMVLLAALPESIRFLATRGDRDDAVRRILGRIDPAARFAPGARFAMREERVTGVPVAHLFLEGRGLGTTLLWIIFFMSLLDVFFMSSWMPTVLSGAGGLSVHDAVIAVTLVQAGGALAAIVLGPVVDRLGFFAVLLPLYLMGTVAVAILGQGGGSHAQATVVMIASFGAGFGVLGGQTTANVLAATFYPTTIRATGVGWALGVGRFGSIVGPLLGGLLIHLRWDNPSLFLAAAVPSLIATLAVAALALTNRTRVAAQAGMATAGPILHP